VAASLAKAELLAVTKSQEKMPDLSNKVLVLGSDMRSFLTVIRSLGRAGKEVHVAWCARSSLAKNSKYVAQVHDVVRPPAASWTTEFLDLLQTEKFDLIVPCNDPSILPLHEHRKLFSSYPIYLIEEPIFETVMDKAAVNKIAAESGLKLPAEVTIRSTNEIEEIRQLCSPYVLKPTQSYTTSHLSGKNHVVIVDDYRSASSQLTAMLERTPVAVQEYFEGQGVGVEFLAKDGKILTAFQHLRLHEPPGGGGSSYRKSCELNPSLLGATTSLIQSLGYSGVGMAEFRYDFKSNDWIFVELNSRFWGSLPLAVACGADFPLFLYDLYCHDRREFPGNYRVNGTCRNWMMDIGWLRKMLAANGRNPRLQLGLAWQLLKELRYPLMARESCDTLARDDRSPGVNEIREALQEIPKKFHRKVFQRKVHSISYRQRTSRLVHQKLKNARNVLFVCKGNICRSPFAEQYARMKLKQLERIDSCGYFPKSNRPSPENGVLAAQAFDVDLSSHRSAEISSGAVEQADVIFVFDFENYHTVQKQFPQAKAKTFLLSSVQESSSPEIVDPYGGTVDDFRSIYSEIASAIDALAVSCKVTS